jgi:hypothetical protein
LIFEWHDQISLEPGALVGADYEPKHSMQFDAGGLRLR